MIKIEAAARLQADTQADAGEVLTFLQKVMNTKGKAKKVGDSEKVNLNVKVGTKANLAFEVKLRGKNLNVEGLIRGKRFLYDFYAMGNANDVLETLREGAEDAIAQLNTEDDPDKKAMLGILTKLRSRN